jgi:hypothetical protein
MDTLLHGIFRMRVLTCAVDERVFKWNALDALRESNVYKQLKLKPAQVHALERNLVQEHLSPLSFSALCALYHVNVVVLHAGHHYRCGMPKYTLRGLVVERMKLIHTYEFTPTKPLYALSHYKLTDLQTMSTKLELAQGTRIVMYAAISEKLKLF